MKSIIHNIKIYGLAFIMLLAVSHKATAQAYNDEISFQEFYDALEPYGIWVDDPQYGTVWVPNVDEDFKPYATNGHWVVTEYGNTWVSDYEWGWAPFHYGRWHFDDYYGWEWVPDYEWGPAWVDWRSGDGYYGWAPLEPGISIDASIDAGYNVPDFYWAFVPQAYITSPRVYDYYVPAPRVTTIIRRTTFIRNIYTNNNRRYVAGPRAYDIERITRNRVPIYRINNLNRPGATRISNNQVNIFRPAVRRTADARPNRVINASAYRNANPEYRIGNRNSGNGYNRANADRLARVYRGNNDANRNVVRINRDNGNRNNNAWRNNNNNNRPAPVANPAVPNDRNRYNRPQPNTQNNNRPEWNGQNGNTTPERRPQWGQQQTPGPQTNNQPAVNPQADQQRQQRGRRWEQPGQQPDQQRQPRNDQWRQQQQQQQQADQVRRQQEQLRDQQRQQQQEQQRQQQDLQRQQQRQQMEQQQNQQREQRQQQWQQRQQQQPQSGQESPQQNGRQQRPSREPRPPRPM